MNPHTPFLPALRARLAPMGSRTLPALAQVRSYTLCQLERCFGDLIPSTLFPKAQEKQNSRDRDYTRWRTFWCMLWQGLNPRTSGREVVRQLQALFELKGGHQLSHEDGAYCRAKDRLPVDQFAKALAATAQAADRQAPPMGLLASHRLLVADGSALTLADTPKNRQTYRPVQCPEPNFPMMRIVVLFSLLSGAILSLAVGDLRTAELPLLHSMFGQLIAGDILVADRGFANFVLLALLQNLKPGVHFIGRSARRIDGRRRIQRLGKGDWLVVWKKGCNPSLWLPSPEWVALPDQLILRTVRGSCYVKGFRVRQVTLVTTLLDSQRYPASEILQAYLRRWRLEMCLNDLKTTLEMHTLPGRSPEMVQKEIYTRLVGHNLLRCVMAQAAIEHAVTLERISFKGSLDALRQFISATNQATTKKKRSLLWARLLLILALDQLPHRPKRREPRAIKRLHKKYPRLNAPRHLFKDPPKRNVRRTIARRRELSLM
jgi:hypothetical protein